MQNPRFSINQDLFYKLIIAQKMTVNPEATDSLTYCFRAIHDATRNFFKRKNGKQKINWKFKKINQVDHFNKKA